jgi:hypothetical protein
MDATVPKFSPRRSQPRYSGPERNRFTNLITASTFGTTYLGRIVFHVASPFHFTPPFGSTAIGSSNATDARRSGEQAARFLRAAGWTAPRTQYGIILV